MRTLYSASAAIYLFACSTAPPTLDDSSSATTADPTASAAPTDGLGSAAPTTTAPPAVTPATTAPPPPDDGFIAEDPVASAAPTMMPMECAGIGEEATEVILPVDVIVVIDNSSSMTEEIIEVQARINQDFAQIMAGSGLDYRVILVARYGDVNVAVGESDHPVCVGAPLGATACTAPDTEALVNNPPVFFHYSSDVGSLEPWCDLLEGFSSPDELGGSDEDRATAWTSLFPSGFSEYLREDAFKHFLVVTDDDSECDVTVDGAAAEADAGPGQGQGQTRYQFNDETTIEGGLSAAEAFDEALLALSPAQFGTASERKYRWHSIVGMVGKTAAAGAVPEPWLPDEPVSEEVCGEDGVSEGPGTGFQQLSVLTGGLRYPSCFSDNFNAVFNAIAEGIVEGAKLSCEWEIPDAPNGKVFDKMKVNVEFASGAATPTVVPKAASVDACADAAGWYFDNEEAPTVIRACPASCTQFQADQSGKVHIVFGCETIIRDAR